MRFYQEITLIRTPEMSLYFIWSKLYTQLHLALVEQQNPDKTVNVGVSFPEYSAESKKGEYFGGLGTKLRVFADSEDELRNLNLSEAFSRLTDYVHLTSIRAVPEKITGYLNVRRCRKAFNLESITHRYARRKNISFEEAKLEQNQRYAEEHKLDLKEAEKHYQRPHFKVPPYIQLQSLSGGRDFSLLIKQEPAEEACKGTFSTYGLSSSSTVPHW